MSTFKQNMNSILNEKIEEVKNSYPSIYSKDDVQLLLIKIQTYMMELECEEPVTDLLSVDEVIKCMNDEMDIEEYASVDYDSAEFSMNGNYVEVDQMEIDWEVNRFFLDLRSNLNKHIEMKKENND